jgi:hypothetical protein
LIRIVVTSQSRPTQPKKCAKLPKHKMDRPINDAMACRTNSTPYSRNCAEDTRVQKIRRAISNTGGGEGTWKSRRSGGSGLEVRGSSRNTGTFEHHTHTHRQVGRATWMEQMSRSPMKYAIEMEK